MIRVLLLIVLTTGAYTAFRPEESHKKVLLLMGSRFEITAVSADEQLAWDAINAAIQEISRIEKLISSWDADSQTSEINRNAGVQPVKVDKELFALIKRSKKISDLTDGAFDISYASADRIWKFDGSVTDLPSDEAIKKSVKKISYQNIILDPEASAVFLKEQGMKIGFGAIGKGYAANRGKQIMQEMGITSGIVNAGGDLMAWGSEVDGSPRKIGVANPKNKQQILAWFNATNMSVVTSGNYEKFITVDGKRYSHIIDPRTGWPVQGLKSVTIISPDAELSDALATSVFVLGKEKGLSLINQLKGVECIIVDEKDELIHSANLKLDYYTTETQDLPALTIGDEKSN